MHTMNPAATCPVNEIGRFVVKLPDNATFYGDSHYVPIAFEASNAGCESRIVGIPEARLVYLPKYRVVGTLCGDRAQRTVDEALVVCGKPITPERYLALWRHGLDEAASPAILAARHGLSVCAVIEAPLAPLWKATQPWSGSPFATFDELHARYASQIENVGEGRFRLAFDLRLDDAARDAFYAEAIVSSALGHDSDAWCAKLILQGRAVARPQCGQLELDSVEA
jgi:hypothetical protein